MIPGQDGSFEGKVAFVTGAANSIGRSTALALAREGASVVAADFSDEGNQETARMIEEAGGKALAVSCDVRRSESVKSALDRAIENFGRLDLAFNNAGVVESATVVDLPEEEWDRVMDTDLRGVFLCMKYEIPLMIERVTGGNSESMISQKPIGRLGRPEEIAAAVIWLCSDAASFVVGHAMVVDGGQTV